ncbi:MAG: hypothetical protein ACLGJB_11695 [Blastocatellia bacterium]
MAVSRNVTVDKGGASISAGEYLAYRLFADPGNPMWVFGCQDLALLAVEDIPRPEYRWYLGDVPASIHDGPHFALDRQFNIPDVYGVELIFAQCPGYRLLIVKLPVNVVVQDITYSGSSAGDKFPEPFTVIRS